MPPEPTDRLRLADGRWLDLWYDDRPGDADLTPLLYHHGTPGSGMGYGPFIEAARRRGLRLISSSRAGYGGSTRHPGRTVADVASDAAAILDHLGTDRAYVAGHSGGGPHALACAALLPDRVLGTALIAGVAPWDAEGLDFLEGMGEENHQEFGAAVRSEAELVAFLEPFREQILGITGPDVAAMFGDLVDDVDRAALTADYADFNAAAMRESQRESFAGWQDDDDAIIAPWGFDLRAIRGKVHVWQGSHDRMVPFAHGEWLAANVGNACPHLHADEGHFSIAVGRFPAIVDALVDGT